MSLTPVSEAFILHWGLMGSTWGVNRTVSQIHALLFLRKDPMTAEEIADTLNVARSNVSNSLKELLHWKLIRVVQKAGDRRDYYETDTDVWELVRTVCRERKQREFDPTIQTLQELIAHPDFAQEPKDVQKRIQDTLQLMETIGIWGNEMLRLSPDTLMKIMKLGAKIQKLIHGNSARTPS